MATPSDNGDGYVSAEHEAAFKGPGKVRGVMRKAPGGGNLHPLDERINRVIAMRGGSANLNRWDNWIFRATKTQKPLFTAPSTFSYSSTATRHNRSAAGAG